MSIKPHQIDPRAPIPEGSTVETVFEVRVQADLGNALREVLTRSFIRAVTQITGRQVLVIGHQEVRTPPEEASS